MSGRDRLDELEELVAQARRDQIAQSARPVPMLLTVEETTKLLRISRSSTYEGIRAGYIPSVRIGRRLLVPRRELLRAFGLDEGAG